jgi:hypothetical protein
VCGHVRKSQRSRITDQLTEHTASARQGADQPPGGLVEPHEQEALQLLTGTIDDPERGIPRPRELSRRVEHLPQHGLEVKLGDERAPHLEQSAELALGQPRRTQRRSWLLVPHSRSERIPLAPSSTRVWRPPPARYLASSGGS